MLAGRLGGNYLFGDGFSTADALLYVMVRWARDSDMALPESLLAYARRVEARPAVIATLREEGLAA
jgi:glutathione S-transferase